MESKNIAIVVRHNEKDEYLLKNSCFFNIVTSKGMDSYDLIRWLYKNVDANYYGFMENKHYFVFSSDGQNCTLDWLGTSEEKILGYSEDLISQQIEGCSIVTYEPKDLHKERIPGNCDINLRTFLTNILSNRFPPYVFSTFERLIKAENGQFQAAYDAIMAGSEYPHLLNFCMDKITFQKYCETLFDILDRIDELVERSRLSSVSFEYRDIIARLLLSIFENDDCQRKKNGPKRLPIASFRNTAVFKAIEPAFGSEGIPIITISSNYYVPYLAVWLQSLADSASPDNYYDVFVLESEISDSNKKKIQQMFCKASNISIRFINPKPLLGNVTFTVSSSRVTTDTYFRVFSPWIFENYRRAIVMDCDIVIDADLKELYSVNLGEKMIGGVLDIVYQGLISADKERYNYTAYEMGMQDPFNYINTGVLVMDLEKLRAAYTLSEIAEFCSTNAFRIQDQDAINAFFEKQIALIDLAWNYYVNLNGWINNCLRNAFLPFKELYDNTSPKIIHYANNPKPWFLPSVPYADKFWTVAKETPFYEEIVYRMTDEQLKKANKSITQKQSKLPVKAFLKEKIIKPIVKPVLPVHSMRREFLKELTKKILGKANRLDWVIYFQRQYVTIKYYQMLSAIPFTQERKNRERIEALKNTHNGERCFFVGLGPSLQISDLEKLKGEVTFAVNNIFSLYGKTDWRPTFYFNQETIVKNYSLIKADLEAKLPLCDFSTSFFTIGKHSKKIRETVHNAIFVPVVNDWCMYYGGEEEMKDFSINCANIVYAAFLSMYSVLQMASYMGFKEIYLVGCDAKYTVKAPHCYERTVLDDKFIFNDKSAMIHTNGINKGFSAMRRAADKHGIKIYNATRGGYLEIFPRVDFDSLDLKKKTE